jgi:hypothetical protein
MAQPGPGLVLPTPSMQSQMHELAKSLPPPRKQNTACDACRSRKVKCHRIPGQEKCQHCQSKNYPCTHFVQQATSEKKRSSATARRPRNLSSATSSSPTSPVGQSSLPHIVDNGIPPYSGASVSLVVKYGLYPRITIESPTHDVLSYLFAPPEDAPSDTNLFNSVQSRSPYAAWGNLAVKLEDDTFKSEYV